MNRILRVWKKRLELHQWRLDLDLDSGTEEGTSAEINCITDYFVATITLASDWKEWDEYYANYIIVHELMHACLRELRWVVANLTVLDDEDPVWKAYEHAEEGYIDLMSCLLIKHLGYA